MTTGKPAGEKAQVPLAFPRSHCSQVPRIHNHVRPLEERKGTEGLKEETVQLHLISTHIESEMLLNEFYHSFPQSKLVVLEKHHFQSETPEGSGAVHLPWSPGTTLRLSSVWIPPHSSRICLSQARLCPPRSEAPQRSDLASSGSSFGPPQQDRGLRTCIALA